MRQHMQGKPDTGGGQRPVVYQLSDRLHDGRTVYVTADEIAATISAWLSELGTTSPLVDDLAYSVRIANWPKAHALAQYLSVDISEIA